MLLAVIVLFGAGPVAARQFKPIRPPSCDAPTELEHRYRVWGPSNDFELPTDPGCTGTPGNPCPHYIDNLSYRRQIVANAWTDVVELRVDGLDLDADGDTLRIGTSTFTGIPEVPFWARATTEDNSGEIVFSTNAAITRQGFHVERARLCGTRTAPAADRPFIGRDRVVGFLQGQDDVVELALSTEDREHVSLALFSESADDDFDLYARCGAVPTFEQYTWASRSRGGQEYLDVDDCAAGTIYVTVHAFRGAGAFSLVALPHKAIGHRVLTVGKGWTGAPENLAQLAAVMSRAVKRVFAATEGNVIVDRIEVYDGPTCDDCGGTGACMFCFKNIPSGAGCALWLPRPLREWGNRCAPQCEVLNDLWEDDRTIAHELMHELYCVDDEYTDGVAANTQCGHSIMANQWGDRQYNVCSPFDHGTDHAPNVAPTALPSAHEQAARAGVSVGWSGGTPDNYEFVDFDFGGSVAVMNLNTAATNEGQP